MSGSGSTSGDAAAAAAGSAAAAAPQRSLHDEIVDFVKAVTAAPQEDVDKTTAARKIQTAVRAAGLQQGASVQVQTFGSFANGLGMHSSDLDLVVTGLLAPDHPRNGGYADKTKVKVNRLLGQLRCALHRAGDLESCEQVRRARVPILKCVLKGSQEVDVSISNAAGPAAAKYMADKAAEYPALRPVVLVLKCILGQAELNDASKGGLSSFALANMAVASLQEDAKAGRSGADFGVSLNSFLLRFGTSFKLYTEGIAVGRGGIVKKEQVPSMAEVLADPIRNDGSDALERLCVEDPQTGREVAGGTGKIRQVLKTFQDAGAALQQAQFLGKPGSCLRALFDVDAAIKRQPRPAAQAPKQVGPQPYKDAAASGKRKRQSSGDTAATSQPAAKRQAPKPPGNAASCGGAAAQQQGPAAKPGKASSLRVAEPAGSLQPAMSRGAGPNPKQAAGARIGFKPGGRHGSGASGGRSGGGRGGGIRDASRPTPAQQPWGQRQPEPFQGHQQPLGRHLGPPDAPHPQQQPSPQEWHPHRQPPVNQDHRWRDSPTSGSWSPADRGAAPLGHSGGAGPAHWGEPPLEPPPQRQGHGRLPGDGPWQPQPRPQGSHIRFPEDDSRQPPLQPQLQQLPQQLQFYHHRRQPQQQAPPPSWRRDPQQDWQPPRNIAADDWQPPTMQPPRGGGGHNGMGPGHRW